MTKFNDMNPHPNLEALFLSLIELLRLQPLEQISVTELTKKSGVSRNFYYRNFNQKEDIITAYLEYSSSLFTRSLAHQSLNNSEILEHHFQHIQDYRAIYTILIQRGYQTLVSQALLSSLNTLKEYGYLRLPSDEYWFTFASAGITSVAMSWILSSKPISVKAITTKTIHFLNGNYHQ